MKWKGKPKYHEPTSDPRIFQSDWLYYKGVVEPIKRFVARVEDDEGIEPPIYVHQVALPYGEIREEAKGELAEQGLQEMIRNCDYLEQYGHWEGLEEPKVRKKEFWEDGKEIPG